MNSLEFPLFSCPLPPPSFGLFPRLRPRDPPASPSPSPLSVTQGPPGAPFLPFPAPRPHFPQHRGPLDPLWWAQGPPGSPLPPLPVLSLNLGLFLALPLPLPFSTPLRYLQVAVSEPSPGIPQFMSTGYLDGIPFVLLRQRRGRVELLTRVDGEWSRAEHWERKTQTLRGMASVETRNLETARGGTTRVPTHGSGFMAVISCLAGSIRGSRSALLTMDGIISPLTQNPGKFMLADSSAETTGKHWEQEGIDAERWTNYLKHNALNYSEIAAPDVHVSGTRGHRDADPILPRGVQFYPNTIAVSWMKGAPNSGGTFHTWARIEVLVEHPGMPEPGSSAWGEAGIGVGNLEFPNGDSPPLLTIPAFPRADIWWESHRGGKDVGTNGLSTGTEQDQGGIPEGDWAGWMDWDQ
uniref:Uncharacterized protein n=1 Tax=Geospiza parvula TaxID=87175 RepID=A0A8U8C1T2_GEOPR